MKVIFLDIDGVLNSIDSAIAFFAKKKNKSMMYNEDRLDPVSIGLIQRVCEETGAKIVVSSTWRMGRTQKDFIELFAAYGWEDFPYLDKTDTAGPVRGSEIQRWLVNNGSPEYIILDDDSDMLQEQHDRFIHVSNVNGFRSKHYCKALRLFGHVDEHLERLESQVNFVRKTNVGEV